MLPPLPPPAVVASIPSLHLHYRHSQRARSSDFSLLLLLRVFSEDWFRMGRPK